MANYETTSRLVIDNASSATGLPTDAFSTTGKSGSLIITLTMTAYTTFVQTQQAAIAISNIKFNAGLGTVTITYDIIPPTTTISDICFPAGTPVKTDQGLIPIEQIDTQVHTLYGQEIIHITQTVTLDKYLICFEKNALGRNMPSATTLMTKDHKIMFKNKLVPAYRFLTFTEGVKRVRYTGEVLYNVLLTYHGTMIINNIVCETLHPENKIAKLYQNNSSNKYKNS